MVGDERNTEPAVFVIIIGAAVAREFDGRAHFLKDLQVIVQAAFGDADLLGTVRRSAGTFEVDEIIKADESMQ